MATVELNQNTQIFEMLITSGGHNEGRSQHVACHLVLTSVCPDTQLLFEGLSDTVQAKKSRIKDAEILVNRRCVNSTKNARAPGMSMHGLITP